MKKIMIFLVIVIAFLGMFWYSYEKTKISTNQKIAYNDEYESVLNKEIDGSRLATIMNKVSDINEHNYLKKDDNNDYISNDTNSINVDIKFIDNDNKIKFEKIFSKEISKFISLYGNRKFILKEIKYHDKTKLVRYLYFEEIQ